MHSCTFIGYTTLLFIWTARATVHYGLSFSLISSIDPPWQLIPKVIARDFFHRPGTVAYTEGHYQRFLPSIRTNIICHQSDTTVYTSGFLLCDKYNIPPAAFFRNSQQLTIGANSSQPASKSSDVLLPDYRENFALYVILVDGAEIPAVFCVIAPVAEHKVLALLQRKRITDLAARVSVVE